MPGPLTTDTLSTAESLASGAFAFASFAGLDGGTLHSVGGGNDQLEKRILAKGDVSVRLNTEVVRIDVVGISAENNTYTVTDADGNQSRFDIVIIACPST